MGWGALLLASAQVHPFWVVPIHLNYLKAALQETGGEKQWLISHHRFGAM